MDNFQFQTFGTLDISELKAKKHKWIFRFFIMIFHIFVLFFLFLCTIENEFYMFVLFIYLFCIFIHHSRINVTLKFTKCIRFLTKKLLISFYDDQAVVHEESGMQILEVDYKKIIEILILPSQYVLLDRDRFLLPVSKQSFSSEEECLLWLRFMKEKNQWVWIH